MLLALTTGVVGVFAARDVFLFYVFWEIMLIPMYFLIGVWGGRERIYAAVKFFLFTAVGSLLMLVAILYLFFRYQASTKIIVIAWVNDENSKRAYGTKSDAYVVFRKMLARGNPPDDWNGLLKESKASVKRASTARSTAEGSA
jgi:NADH:ubiquinone oxidoreductase subunit 4 (subunit M)